MNPIIKLFRKIALGYRSDQDSYVKYLKKIGVRIGEHIEIFTPANTFIDNVNPHLLEIGSNVSITGPATILTHDYSVCVTKKWTQGEILGCQKKTVIGDNVFLGWGACVLPGSIVGNNTIIGAYSVVSGVVLADSVYAGNPAKRICSIEEYYNRRKSKQIEEAVNVYRNYVETYHIEPTKEVFHEYFYLFMGANTDINQIPKVFEKKFYDHGNYKESRDAFMRNKPPFCSFDDFISFAKKQTCQNANEDLNIREDVL